MTQPKTPFISREVYSIGRISAGGKLAWGGYVEPSAIFNELRARIKYSDHPETVARRIFVAAAGIDFWRLA